MPHTNTHIYTRTHAHTHEYTIDCIVRSNRFLNNVPSSLLSMQHPEFSIKSFAVLSTWRFCYLWLHLTFNTMGTIRESLKSFVTPMELLISYYSHLTAALFFYFVVIVVVFPLYFLRSSYITEMVSSLPVPFAGKIFSVSFKWQLWFIYVTKKKRKEKESVE